MQGTAERPLIVALALGILSVPEPLEGADVVSIAVLDEAAKHQLQHADLILVSPTSIAMVQTGRFKTMGVSNTQFQDVPPHLGYGWHGYSRSWMDHLQKFIRRWYAWRVTLRSEPPTLEDAIRAHQLATRDLTLQYGRNVFEPKFEYDPRRHQVAPEMIAWCQATVQWLRASSTWDESMKVISYLYTRIRYSTAGDDLIHSYCQENLDVSPITEELFHHGMVEVMVRCA